MAKLPLDKMATELEDIANDITGGSGRKKIYAWDRMADAITDIAGAAGIPAPSKKYSTKKALVGDMLEALADQDFTIGAPREMENEILAGTISVYTNPTASVVGTGIFTNRSSLTYVEMPKCETIGDAAFLGCSNLQTVSFPECTIIQQGAFSYCSNLASVEFNKCTEIKSGAFRYCYSLQTASFPKCTQIDSGAFQECSMLSNINAPLCTTISEYVFLSCNKLSSAIFPECISIGFSAFQNCYSLSTISFPKCITIGNLGFFSCNIREAIFPECKSVGDTVFVFCTELSKISFPKCEHIGSNAFAECTKLLSAYFLTNNVPTLGQSAFSNTPIMGKTTETGGVPGSVYVKASLLSQFKSAQYWSSFSSRIVGLTDEEIAALDANN